MAKGDVFVTSTLLLSEDSHRCDGALPWKNGVDGFVDGNAALCRATKACGSTEEECRRGMERSNAARFRQPAVFILPLVVCQI